MSPASAAWLAPLLPLAAFAALASGLAYNRRVAGLLSVGAVAGSLVATGLGLFAAAQGVRASAPVLWFAVGRFRLQVGLRLDPLSATASVLVALISLVVFVYSLAYMREDPSYGRFFAEMSLFAGAMLALVLAGDLLTLFIAWELVSAASYLLIGFWRERRGAPEAATEAFLIVRVGDLALLLAAVLLISALGSGSLGVLFGGIASGELPGWLLTTAAVLVAVAAVAKSAQLPFQIWLPDAMLGPTPVSALLHSATMVAAGVYTVARLYPLFLAAPVALALLAWVGVATALFASAVALVETNLKRLLAYSTISQLGLMFAGLGAGSLLAGLLLLIAQAFYKALLFLAEGAVSRAVEGESLERMGGLSRRMPGTFAAFVVGAVALAGLPVTALPAKDPVLAAAWRANVGLFALALTATLLTALYSARALGVAFLGVPAAPARQAREAGPGLLVPILTLSALLAVALLINSALLGRPLARFLGLSTPDLALATGLALAVAAGGFALGLEGRARWPDSVLWPPVRPAAPALTSELGFIPAYRALSRGGLWLIAAAACFEQAVFGAPARRAAQGMLEAARAACHIDLAGLAGVRRAAQGMVEGARAACRIDLAGFGAAAQGLGEGLVTLGQGLRGWQTGRIGNYLLSLLAWSLGLIAVAAVAAAVLGT